MLPSVLPALADAGTHSASSIEEVEVETEHAERIRR
jgi:hypothetical protein